MSKTSLRRIDQVFKRKRDDANEIGEDQSIADPPQQLHNQHEYQPNEAVTFRGIEYLQRDPGLRPYAYYVHCYAHRLQLALVDASK
jgi:hypothetical protein